MRFQFIVKRISLLSLSLLLILILLTLKQSVDCKLTIARYSGEAVHNSFLSTIAYYLPCKLCYPIELYEKSIEREINNAIRLESCEICLHHVRFVPGLCGVCGSVITYQYQHQYQDISDDTERRQIDDIGHIHRDYRSDVDGENKLENLPDELLIHAMVTRNQSQVERQYVRFVVQHSLESFHLNPIAWLEVIHPSDIAVISSQMIFLKLLVHVSPTNEFTFRLNDRQHLIEMIDVTYKNDINYIPVSKYALQEIDIAPTDIRGSNALQFRLLVDMSNDNDNAGRQYLPSMPMTVEFEVVPNSTEFARAQGFFRQAFEDSNNNGNIGGLSQGKLMLAQQYSKELRGDCRGVQDARSVLTKVDSSSSIRKLISNKTIHIMNIMGGNFDGQKKMMIDQWSSSQLTNSNIIFSLLWVCSAEEKHGNDCVVHPAIKLAADSAVPPVKILFLHPISVQKSLWNEGLDGDSNASSNTVTQGAFLDYLNGEQPTETKVYEYVVQRLRAANYILDDVKPVWVLQLWLHYLEPFLTSIPSVDIVFFGNTGAAADIMVPEAATFLNFAIGISNQLDVINGITVMMDLAARIVASHWLLQPHVLITPSAYALCEYQRVMGSSPLASRRKSSETLINSLQTPSADSARAYILPPSVYMSLDKEIQCPVLCRYFRKNVEQENRTIEAVIRDKVLFGLNRCNNACIVIGFVGRLTKMKSPSLFLNVAKLILSSWPNAVFVIAGTGGLDDSLRIQAKKLGIANAVQFYGEITPDRLQSVFASMDILVNPSNSDQETFCLVNIEAMALGIPVVSFGLYGQGEYFTYPNSNPKGFNSLIATELSAESLAESTLALMGNAALRAIISKNALLTAQQYSQQRSAEAFRQVVEEIYASKLYL